MKFEVLISTPLSAERNMAVDAALLHSLAADPRCILHFYRWEETSATYGYFLDPYAYLKKEAVTRRRLQLAQRPTGGGIIFHHCDLAFSILLPITHPRLSLNTLDNYALVNQVVIEAVHCFAGAVSEPALLPTQLSAADTSSRHFCMALPTKYDVMIGGRKVGGGAQRRTKHGLLHQGTIALSLPSQEFLEDVLHLGTGVIESMRRYSYPLLSGEGSSKDLEEARLSVQALLVKFTKSNLSKI